MRVVNLTTGYRALFKASTWLDPSIPGCEAWVQLTAEPDDLEPSAAHSPWRSQQPGELNSIPGRLQGEGSAVKTTKNLLLINRLGQPGYTVTFHTSNILGVGGSQCFKA